MIQSGNVNLFFSVWLLLFTSEINPKLVIQHKSGSGVVKRIRINETALIDLKTTTEKKKKREMVNYTYKTAR